MACAEANLPDGERLGRNCRVTCSPSGQFLPGGKGSWREKAGRPERAALARALLQQLPDQRRFLTKDAS
jgi:hypothetical protein